MNRAELEKVIADHSLKVLAIVNTAMLEAAARLQRPSGSEAEWDHGAGLKEFANNKLGKVIERTRREKGL